MLGKAVLRANLRRHLLGQPHQVRASSISLSRRHSKDPIQMHTKVLYHAGRCTFNHSNGTATGALLQTNGKLFHVPIYVNRKHKVFLISTNCISILSNLGNFHWQDSFTLRGWLNWLVKANEQLWISTVSSFLLSLFLLFVPLGHYICYYRMD